MPLLVRDVMSKPVKTLREDQTLHDALSFLHEHQVRHIPVLDATGKLVGVITDRDVKRASPSALIPAQREVWEQVVHGTRLARIMTKDPWTAGPGDPVDAAVRRFVEDKIGCLPVVEAGRLVGIVTARDLLRAMLKVLAQ